MCIGLGELQGRTQTTAAGADDQGIELSPWNIHRLACRYQQNLQRPQATGDEGKRNQCKHQQAQTQTMYIIEHDIAHADPAMYQHGNNKGGAGDTHDRVADPRMPFLVSRLRVTDEMYDQVQQEDAEIHRAKALHQPVAQSVCRAAHRTRHR